MSKVRWTPERVATLRELSAKGLTAAEIGRIMGETPDAVAGARRRHRMVQGAPPPTLTPQPAPPPDPVVAHASRREARLERSERASLLDRLSASEKRFAFWSDVRGRAAEVDIPRREFGSGLREGTAVAMLSDAHIEELVDPAKVADRNAYNLEISEARMMRFFEGFRWLIDFNRGAWKIRDAVLWLGGDLMTGYIHDELIESNLLSPTEAVLCLKRRLRTGINILLRDIELDTITIPCSYGNHGRVGQKRRIKTGAENSYEWMLYNLLAEDYEDEPRVRFVIPRGAHTFITAYDKTLHFHHGDEVTYWGGVGGLTIPLNKRVPMWDNVRKADLHHIGHFHQLTDLGHTLVNGSVIGYTEYAYGIGASFEPPQQMSYILDSKRGKTNVAPIWVDEAKS